MIKKQELIQFIHLVYNDNLKKADAIVCLEGDGFFRLKEVINLYQAKIAPQVVISGGFDNPPFSLVANKMKRKLIQLGVAKGKIIIEGKSQNTYEQGVEITRLSKEKGWRKIILVASHFHQCRAYLTFLAARKKMKSNLIIMNAPARDISWFKKITTNEKNSDSRINLLLEEFQKIEQYKKKHHVVSFAEAIEYQKLKERTI